MGKFVKIEEFQRKLDQMSDEGWQFRITPSEPTWWETRVGAAEFFLDELAVVGPVNYLVEWYQLKTISEIAEGDGKTDLTA
jgi:hypothetical protein